MKTYKIHLIRHARYTDAEKGKYIGHTDISLSDEGKEQLAEFKNKYHYPEPEAVFSSPLKRCVETCSLLYPDKQPIIIDGLTECNFGEFENKTADELRDNEDFAGWLAGKNAPPFGESSKEFGDRICSTFEKIVDGLVKSGVHEAAIITHGGVISIILSAYGLPQAPMHQWAVPNCCGFTLLIDASLWMRGKKAEIYGEVPI